MVAARPFAKLWEAYPFEFEIGFANVEKYFDEVLGSRWEKLSANLGLQSKDRLFELKNKYRHLVRESN